MTLICSLQETLTGFKWMGNVSHDLIQKGKTVLFAFEEAIGFMNGSEVRTMLGVYFPSVMNSDSPEILTAVVYLFSLIMMSGPHEVDCFLVNDFQPLLNDFLIYFFTLCPILLEGFLQGCHGAGKFDSGALWLWLLLPCAVHS